MKTWTIFNLKKFFFKLKLWLFFSRRKETYVHLEETYVHLCKFPYSVKIFFLLDILILVMEGSLTTDSEPVF